MIIDTAADFDIRQYLRLDMMPHFLCPGCGHESWHPDDLRLFERGEQRHAAGRDGG